MVANTDIPTRPGADRRTFWSPELEAQFRHDGFVVVSLLDPADVEVLREQVFELYRGSDHGFHTTMQSEDHDYRASVHSALAPRVEDLLAPVLDDHRVFSTQLLIKWPDADSWMHSHQDWSVVDETRVRACSIWLPLVESTEENGAIRVVAGSHRWLTSPRPSPQPPGSFVSPGWEIQPEEMQPVLLQPGQALLYDGALLHSSPTNRSDAVRPALGAGLVPRDVPLMHFHVPGGDELQAFEVEASFFAGFDIGTAPLTDPVSVQRFPEPEMSADELRLRTGMPVADGWEPPTGLFRDAQLQRRFDTEGYVVLDLFDRGAIEAFAAQVRDEAHEYDGFTAFADGFHTTLFDPRPDYRRSIAAQVDEFIAPGVREVFRDPQVFLAALATKLPSGEPLPRHLDWSFVDEDEHESVTFWCPLQDVTELNGALGVVERSHHAVDFVRGVNFPNYELHGRLAEVLPRHRVVELHAGQVILTSHRLIHYSTTNHTDEIRSAIACAVSNRGAAIRHFSADAEGRQMRHEVSDDFFHSYTPGQDPTIFEGCLRTELVCSDTPVAVAPWPEFADVADRFVSFRDLRPRTAADDARAAASAAATAAAAAALVEPPAAPVEPSEPAPPQALAVAAPGTADRLRHTSRRTVRRARRVASRVLRR